MIETFTTETFRGRLGETFRLAHDGAAPIELALEEVTPLGESVTGASVRGDGGGRAEAFSAVFRARGVREVLPQRTYRVEHDAIGAFELFLVPIAADRDGVRYEAVFT